MESSLFRGFKEKLMIYLKKCRGVKHLIPRHNSRFFVFSIFTVNIFTIVHYLQKWRNEFLSWKPSEFGGIKTLNIDPTKVWVPDITLYNKYVKFDLCQNHSIKSFFGITQCINICSKSAIKAIE